MKVLIENPEGAVKVMGDFSNFKYFKNDDTLCLYTDTVDEDDTDLFPEGFFPTLEDLD